MELELWQAALLQTIVIGSPILLAACGELLGQRVGVFNIGIEGVMLMGAVGGFMLMAEAGNVVVGLIGAAAFGAGFVFLFGLATVVLRANQVVAGFGLWLLGLGLSSQIGRPYTGKRAEHPIEHWEIPGLHEIPWVGDILFEHLWLAYVAFLIPFFIALVMFRTRHGLNIRSVGEDPASADAAGVSVIAWRLAYVVFGGALIGLSGAFFSLGTAQNWTPFMTSGLGWIGLAVVIFAGWRPLLLNRRGVPLWRPARARLHRAVRWLERTARSAQHAALHRHGRRPHSRRLALPASPRCGRRAPRLGASVLPWLVSSDDRSDRHPTHTLRTPTLIADKVLGASRPSATSNNELTRSALDAHAEMYRERNMLAVVVALDEESQTGRAGDSNDAVSQAVARNADVLIGFGSVDPAKGEAAVRETRRCIEELGLRGMKFMPLTQAFFVDEPAVRPILRNLCGARRSGDDPHGDHGNRRRSAGGDGHSREVRPSGAVPRRPCG